MLPPDFAPMVAERLKALQGPVKLDYFHQSDGSIIVPGRQPCPSCPPTLEVLEEIAALHDDLTLRVHDYYSDREAVAKWGAERVYLDPTIVQARNRALNLQEREGAFQGPIAVEVDDDGHVFVLETARHRVQVFSKQTAMFAGEL